MRVALLRERFPAASSLIRGCQIEGRCACRPSPLNFPVWRQRPPRRTYSAANNAEEVFKDPRLLWLAHEQRASDKGERAPACRDSAFVVAKISRVWFCEVTNVPDHGPVGKLWSTRHCSTEKSCRHPLLMAPEPWWLGRSAGCIHLGVATSNER